MEALRRFLSIVHADLLARVRTPRFWLAIGAVAMAAWWCFPSKGSSYMILGLNGQYRGQYSSAWIGMVLAMTSIWLSLIGFYLVRGTLARDIDTRVWQLLVATPMRRHTYLLAKWCSHLAVLALVAGAGLAVGAASQWWRGEDTRIDLIELLKPVLLLQLPGLALTAMFALWFDLAPWLRRTAGSVLYFLLWLAMLAATAQNLRSADAAPQPGLLGDPFGVAVFHQAVRAGAAPQIEEALRPGFCLGCGTSNTAVRTFDWSHWEVAPQALPGRLFWLLLAALGVAACAPLLDRAAARSSSASGKQDDGGSGLVWLSVLLRPLQRSVFGTLLASELQLTLRQRKLWWWLAVLGAAVMQLAGTVEAACFAALAAWLLCLDIHAHAALRESASGTAPVVFSAARAGGRILGARAAMLVLLGVVLTLPALLRFALTAPLMAAALLAIAISLAAWALALGTATRSALPFEVLACVLAYLSINGAPLLHAGADSRFTLTLHCAALPVAVIVLWTMWPRLVRARAT
ncbi:MAG: hypothetical protein ABW202_15785 [Duganella sp.]